MWYRGIYVCNIFYVYKLKYIFNCNLNNYVIYFFKKLFIIFYDLFNLYLFKILLEMIVMKLFLFDYKRNIDRNIIINYIFFLISFIDICVDWLIVNVVWFRFFFYYCIYVIFVLLIFGCGFRCLYLFFCIIGGDV